MKERLLGTGTRKRSYDMLRPAAGSTVRPAANISSSNRNRIQTECVVDRDVDYRSTTLRGKSGATDADVEIWSRSTTPGPHAGSLDPSRKRVPIAAMMGSSSMMMPHMRGGACSGIRPFRSQAPITSRRRLTTPQTPNRLPTNTVPEASSSGAVPMPESKPSSGGPVAFMQAFWKFLRPHTIRGTLLGTFAVTSRALMEAPELIDWGLLPKALMGLLALLCGNGFIVGINQIYDVDIDAVNKPFLPIAAGELSKPAAWGLVLALATGGMAIVLKNFGPLISQLYAFGLFLGTIYSIPPFRLKRFAIPAFMIIACVRGVLLNFGVYYSTRAALGIGFVWSPIISFITVFVTVFAIVIAITKDLPDVDGDREYNIETFATKVGVKNVSLMASGLLLSNYIGAIYLALTYSAFNLPIMAGAHSILAVVLVVRTWRLNQLGYTRDALMSYYRWIWNLFYSETRVQLTGSTLDA
eukprot:gene26829-4424_t